MKVVRIGVFIYNIRLWRYAAKTARVSRARLTDFRARSLPFFSDRPR